VAVTVRNFPGLEECLYNPPNPIPNFEGSISDDSFSLSIVLDSTLRHSEEAGETLALIANFGSEAGEIFPEISYLNCFNALGY